MNLLQSMTNGTILKINENIEKIISNYTNINFGENISNFSIILQNIGKILLIKFDYVHIENNTQSLITTSLFDMLNYIMLNDVHKRDGYVCDYHQETLFEHLVLAMLTTITYQSLNDNDYDNNNDYKMMSAFIALVHDIGKMSTLQFINDNGKKWTSYQFHGEMGSGLLANAYNDQFAVYFNKDEWDDICRTICVHMCGYHATTFTDKWTEKRINMLRCENVVVKKLLTSLSYGDHFGAIRKEELYESADDFISSRKVFSELISPDFISDEFFTKYNHNIMLVLYGMSASGKSTLRKQLEDYLLEKNINYCSIERDLAIMKVMGKKKNLTINEKPTGELYEELYSDFIREKSSLEVNEFMKQEIQRNLKQGKVIILDTVMSLFHNIKKLDCNELKKVFIIGVHSIRNKLITTTDSLRMNKTVEEQLKITGNTSLFSFLPNDINYKNLTSKMTGRIDPNTNLRPSIVFMTSWNGIGLNPLYNFVDKISTLMNKKINKQNHLNHLNDFVDENIITVVDYVNNLEDKGFSHKQISDHFDTLFIRALTPYHLVNTQYKDNFLLIKYFETCNNWSYWARQCRGVILYKNDDEENSRWVFFKYLLTRGAELLTSLHINNGIIETENVFMKLSDSQLNIMEKIQKRLPLNGTLSFKIDGSLLGISLYSRKNIRLINSIIDSSNDPLAILIRDKSKSYKLPFVPVLSTQGTFFVGEAMVDYMVTAITSSVIGTENLYTLAENLTPLDIFQLYSDQFFHNLSKLYNEMRKKYDNTDYDLDIITISCEAFCKNKTTAWTNNPNSYHRELTISYPTADIKVLGVSFLNKIKNDIKFVPHFDISQLITETNFKEPAYWNIEQSSQIDDMMKSLSDVIWKRKTVCEFYETYPPTNSNNDQIIDYEGFILSIPVRSFNDDYDYECNKIKTEEYYKGHKLKDNNIPYLCELGIIAGDIFPFAKLVNVFFTTTQNKLENVCNKILVQINLPLDKNHLYVGLSDKARESYHKQNDETKIRMLINASSSFKQILYDIFNEEYINMNSSCYSLDVINSILKNIINEIKPWKGDYVEKITEMITKKDDHIGKLFDIMNSSADL